MDAISLLTKQHRKVEQLFSEIEKDSTQNRSELMNDLAKNLIAHMKIEEEIFYPSSKEIDEKLVEESYEEHQKALMILDTILAEEIEEQEVDELLEKLKSAIEHHVKEEEQQLFPKCKAAMEQEDLKEIGDEMQVLFENIMSGTVTLEELEADELEIESDNVEDEVNESEISEGSDRNKKRGKSEDMKHHEESA